MALSPTLSIVPFIGLDALCTVLDGPATRFAIIGSDGFVGLNTLGDDGNSIVSNPQGRTGALRVVLLLVADDAEESSIVQFAVNNPTGVLGLQNAAQQAYQPDCYDPSQFYPRCTATLAQTNYTTKEDDIPLFSSFTEIDSPSTVDISSPIGAVRSYNQYEAINLAGLGNVGQNGCTIVQLTLPPQEGNVSTVLQIDIDFCATSAS